MQSIPLLLPDASHPRTIAPTDIAQYIRLNQCGRYLRLRLHERVHGRSFLSKEGVAAQAIPPILTRSGGTFEQIIEAQVNALGTGARASAMEVIHCRDAAISDPTYAAGEHNAVVVRLAQELAPGAVVFLFQARLRVTVGTWQIRGDVDLLRMERDAAGELHVLITDMKSSASAKVEHRLQVAFYHEMLATLFATNEVSYATLGTAILYRGPATGTSGLTPEEEVRHEEQAAQAQALFGVRDALLEVVANPDDYRAEVADLVTGSGSVTEVIVETEFADLSYHLSRTCDGCMYNAFCMKWSAEHDDLSLLPHLSDHEKNALRAHDVRTVQQLATLKAFSAPGSTDLIAAPGQEALVRRLSTTPRIGPRLDELVHRARRYRAWKHDDLRSLSFLPGKGYGSLPLSTATLHPNLVRVYIDAQYDYLNDRLYLIGALVVACADGVEAPERRRTIVQLSDGAPLRKDQEAQLLIDWISATFGALNEVAAPDAEGKRSAPIHLIFANRQSQQQLLDALARHFGAITTATPLYDFITQIAALDSPLFTFLDQEMRELKNYPLICQSLQAVARFLRFDWNSPAPYTQIFRARLFDDRGKLDEDEDGEAIWYTSRARFSSQIPLEYAYAAWDDLPPPSRLDTFAPYRQATVALLREFQARRLDAMEHIAHDFKGNGQAVKTSFDLSSIASFTGQARNFADALTEFLTLEHHAKLGAWKSARVAPPERRMLAGETLIVHYRDEDQDPELLATLQENERRRALRAAYTEAFLTANPTRKRATLSKAQREETEPLPLPAPYRLRIDCTGMDCSVAEALALTTIRPEDRLILAPRTTFDERLPLAERVPLTPTVKQLLYGQRVTLTRINGVTGLIEVELNETRGGDTKGYVFPTIAALARPFVDGERYTLDSDPNDWYGSFCAQIVDGLQGGQPNTVYSRLADPRSESVLWSSVSQKAQQRFMDGLDAFHRTGKLHAFDSNQRRFIALHGDVPTLLVQGPPGTGKSYVTAFALLARMQGALAADRNFQILLSCKTHAATNVLLEKLVAVQQQLRALQEVDPTTFAMYFDVRILDVPLYRLRPSNGAPAGVQVLEREDKALPRLQSQRWCIAGATPAAIRGILKDAGPLFGQAVCDCLVLDEASQMNLPEACMAGLPLKHDGQLIVVGDHRQMPPIIAHAWGEERRRTFQAYEAYESLFVTLLQRQPQPPLIQFAESFRLHRVMADFLREAIYRHDGIHYYSQRDTVLDSYAHEDTFVESVLRPEYPLVVVVHDEAGSQVANPFEQALLTPILSALSDPARYGLDHEGGVGVVVPHRAQRAALQEAVPQLAPRDPQTGLLLGSAIDTVERFQGGERRAIVVSATESDRDYLRTAGDFLLDPRRLNVALSRAKEKMVLVASRSVFTFFSADEEQFANVQIWKNLLRHTCTDKLWEGEQDGTRVEVWGKGVGAYELT